MTKTTQATAVKEAFFQEYLVPVGQLAELYTVQLKKYCKWDHHALSQLLFDNLGLVSIFAISPATASDEKLFSALSVQMEHLKATLKEDLVKLNVAKPDHTRTSAFRNAAHTLAERIKPQMAALHTCMKFSDDKRGAWLAPLVENPTALTQDGRYSKWRTLVRNMDFQLNMAALGLATLAESVSLGSHQGREELPELWRSLFRATVTGVPTDTADSTSSDYLPSGITVQSNNVGALAVTCKFDPKRALKKQLTAVAAEGIALPFDINQRLVPVDLTTLCGYRQLAATVEETIQWRDNQVKMAQETSDAIIAFQKTDKLAKARARLQQTLSAEDLELLAEAGDVKMQAQAASTSRTAKTASKSTAVKPAAKRATRKPTRSKQAAA